MTDSSMVKLQMQVYEDDADAERKEKLTLSLIGQLGGLDIELVEQVKAEKSVKGAKGELVTTVLTIAVAAIPGLISLLQQWIGGNRKVSVEAPNGAKIEFTPNKRYTEDEIAELIERLNQLPVDDTSTTQEEN